MTKLKNNTLSFSKRGDKNPMWKGEVKMRDKGNCFCGKKAIGGVGIPVIQLTESGKAVNLTEGQSSMITNLCPYHLVLVERGLLKTDGNTILKTELLLEFENHEDECLLKYLKDNKGKKGIGWKRFIIESLLEARNREKTFPEFLKKIKGKTDIVEMMKIFKETSQKQRKAK